MQLPKPPKASLIESVVYREYVGEGDYNNRVYADRIAIGHVRVDRSPKFSWSGNGKVLLYSAVVFCYEGLTEPLPKFKEQSLLEFDGREHTIVQVIKTKEFDADKLYSYELEVV